MYNYEEHFDKLVQLAYRAVSEKQGNPMPAIFVFKGGEAVGLIPIPSGYGDSNEIKNTFIAVAKEVMRRVEADCYAVVTECWMGPPNETEIPPSKHPDAKDALIITMEYGDTQLCRIYEAKPDNTLERINLSDGNKPTTFSGRLSGLLKDHGVEDE